MMAIRDDGWHQDVLERWAQAIRQYISGELSWDEIEPIRLSMSTTEWQGVQIRRQQYIAEQESERIDQVRKTFIAGLVSEAQASSSPNLTNRLLAEILKKLHGMA
jgi:hypothetical protein